jgi:EEF1A lysine methyltransferase 2
VSVYSRAYKYRFGEETVDKIVEWVAEVARPTPTSVLEIGTGNGILLLTLLERVQPRPRVFGIDYSADAISLARAVMAKWGLLHDFVLEFAICDFLQEDVPMPSAFRQDDNEWEGWDLILDKGTYDAIALGEKDELGRSPTASYPLRVAKLLRPGGCFLITCTPH